MHRTGRLLTPVVALLVGAAYAGILVLTREIGADDFAMLRTLIGRRRPA
jgi:hypothetical protein